MLKKILLLLFLALIASLFITLYKPELLGFRAPLNKLNITSTSSPPQADEVAKTPNEILSVLGAATQRALSTTTEFVDRVTSESDEALINQTVENISKEVKDLPQEQVKKIKYEFCKDVIEEGTSQ